jgi:hypothetical protein
MSIADAPIASFDFANGPLRGTHLILLPRALLHRGGAFHETIPLHAVAAIRVGFARNDRQIAWGGALIVIGLILIAASGPLATLAGAAADEVAAQARSGHGAASLVVAVFHSLQMYARLLPVVSGMLALWAAALVTLGWLGVTTLTLTLAGAERAFAVRGRSGGLYEFADAASERILESRR